MERSADETSARSRPPRALGYRVMKRAIDLVGASVGLSFGLPAIGAVSVAVYASMGRPLFYRQVRPGLHERPFRLWKFRTMSNERGADGQLKPDGERLTRVGRFLREYSLDELPQLINVFSGEMSLVGPRPLLWRYLPRYSERQHQRHDVKPGITGWAQINGRNGLDWPSRLEMDSWYAENASTWLDVKILAKTVLKVFDRSDVFAGAGAELEEFWGNQGSPDGTRAFPVEEDETARR